MSIKEICPSIQKQPIDSDSRERERAYRRGFHQCAGLLFQDLEVSGRKSITVEELSRYMEQTYKWRFGAPFDGERQFPPRIKV
jgi:hypothetical protein